jgi:nitrite reductase/ring-hydroxylating ferredoxin subunit
MDATSLHTLRLASIDDIPEGEGREFKIGDRYVAIFHHQGQFYALEDVCPHAGAPLNNGPLHNGTVTCLWHGWRFNLHDGVCVNFARGQTVSTYPISIRGQDLYVTLPFDGTITAS